MRICVPRAVLSALVSAVAAATSPECSIGAHYGQDAQGLIQAAVTFQDQGPIQAGEARDTDTCGVPGNSRRRCRKTRTNCAADTQRSCNVFDRGLRAKRSGSGCSAFQRTCNGRVFCGVTRDGVSELAAANTSGRTPLACCFGREGGWSGIPTWYRQKWYRKRKRCIDEQMKNEMILCVAEAEQKESAARATFIALMDDCAQRHGMGSFAVLLRRCSTAGVLEKMEDCRAHASAVILGLNTSTFTTSSRTTATRTTVSRTTRTATATRTTLTPTTLTPTATSTATLTPTATSTTLTSTVTSATLTLTGDGCVSTGSDSSRRRCAPTRNCASSGTACTVLDRRFSAYQTAAGCSAFSRTCGSAEFCGLTGPELETIAAFPFNRSALSCCFGREGGHLGVPDWYTDRDYRDKHKCIDSEMEREMTVCSAEARERTSARRAEFMDLMDDCARRHGVGRFTKLMQRCSEPDILRAMEECRGSVTFDMVQTSTTSTTTSLTATTTSLTATTTSLTATTTTRTRTTTTSTSTLTSLTATTLTATTLTTATASTQTSSTTTPEPTAPDSCGTNSGGRRRCARVTECQRNSQTCRVLTSRFAGPPLGSTCVLHERTCADGGFCGLTRGVLDILAAEPSGRSAMSCCLGRQGGWRGLPQWYLDRDWQDRNKCIDTDMMNELADCERVEAETLGGKQQEFASLLDACAAERYGVASFGDLSKECPTTPGLLAQMEECRATVTSGMLYGTTATDPAATVTTVTTIATTPQSTPVPTTPAPSSTLETTTVPPLLSTLVTTVATTPQSTPVPTASATTATPPSAPTTVPPPATWCGFPSFSGSRRRCPAPVANCTQRPVGCNVYTTEFAGPPDGDECVEFEATCGNTPFCGITQAEKAALVPQTSGRSDLSCCFGREGGYTGVPDWYTGKDFMDPTMCIDSDMYREMFKCVAEVTARHDAMMAQFRLRMTICANILAGTTFEGILSNCGDPAALGQAVGCRNAVLSTMQGLATTTAVTTTTTIITTTVTPKRCGLPGGSRRRCVPTTNCQSSSTTPCRVLTSKFAGPLPGGDCMAYERTCFGPTQFCALTRGGMEDLASTPDGRGALSCCFGRQGGYNKLPGWYRYRHFQDPSRCIDGEMLREMTACVPEAELEEETKKDEFMDRLDACSRGFGESSFNALIGRCASSFFLGLAERCKAEVMSEMMPFTQEQQEQ